MPRFDFKSPGAEATGAIHQFLLEQEVQRRQHEQDALAQDREERLRQHEAQQMALGRAQLASIDDARKATIEDRASARGEKIAHATTPGLIDASTAEAIGKFNPSLVKDQMSLPARTPAILAGTMPGATAATMTEATGEQPAQTQPFVTPGQDAKDLGSAKTGQKEYTGDSEQQQKLKQEQQENEAIATFINDPKTPEDVKARVKFAQATGNKALIADLLKPKASEFKFHEVGGFIYRENTDGTLTKVAEGRAPATGPSPTSEAAMITRLQTQWDKAQGANTTMQRQYELMKTGLDRFKAGDTNGGSQAVLVTFQKILDPTSVVRESEYARSAAGLGLLNRLEGQFERASQGGAGVPAAELASMVETARQFMEGVKHSTDGVRARSARTADRYKIPHDLIFTDEDGGNNTAGGGKKAVARYNPATGKTEPVN